MCSINPITFGVVTFSSFTNTGLIKCLIVGINGYHMNNHIYSTLFKTQEREPDRRSREIEQRKESQKTQTQTKQQGHVTLSTECTCI